MWSINGYTHPFNGPTRVSRYQKGKTNLDFTGARDSEWQWHQLGHMQVCTSLQTDNHASIPLSFYRPDALPAAQPTVSKHRRQFKTPKAIKRCKILQFLTGGAGQHRLTCITTVKQQLLTLLSSYLLRSRLAARKIRRRAK